MKKKPATEQVDEASPAPTGNLNALAGRVTPEARQQARLERERKEAERLEQDKQDAAYEARCYRRLERFERWAKKQPHDELAEAFSLALLLLIERGKTKRSMHDLAVGLAELAEDASVRARAAESVARDSISTNLVQTAARRRGAARKLANDPKQAAKAKVKQQWLEWQDGRRQFANQADFARHACEKHDLRDSGNVQKWCRQWRQEGAVGELADPPAC